MKPSTLILAVVVMMPAAAFGESDNVRLEGVPIPPEATITIDLAGDSEVPAFPAAHLRAVSGVYEGMRIPLPRAVDGSCVTNVVVGVEGLPDYPADVSADGRTFTQHKITQQVETGIDVGTCEIVVSVARATDHQRRKHIKQHPPRIIRELPAATSSAAQFVNPREFENPCILYQFDSYSRADLRRNGVTYSRAFDRANQRYFDQPSRAILFFWTAGSNQWSDVGNGYWISTQSAHQVYSDPWSWPYWLGVTNTVLGGGPGISMVMYAGTFAQSYGMHFEQCSGRPDGYANHNISCVMRHYIYQAWWHC